MINVIIFNGGRGASTILPILLENKDLRVQSVVNAYDDGKSTGEIRDFFDMLGPSDIRKTQQLMLPKDNIDFASIDSIFDYRFPKKLSQESILEWIRSESIACTDHFFDFKITNKDLHESLKLLLETFLESYAIISAALPEKRLNFKDCSLMNCLYAGAFIKYERNIEMAASYFEKIFNLKGSVLPTNIENKKLVGIRSDGTLLFSEAEIVELRSSVEIDRIYVVENYPSRAGFSNTNYQQRKYYLEMHHSFVEATARVKRAILDADIIIYAPGTQHSSLYPTYLSRGIPSSIVRNTRAKKFFITNIGADYETPFYKAHDYPAGALKYLNLGNSRDYDYKDYFDYILINNFQNGPDNNYVQINHSELSSLQSKIILDNFELMSSGKHDGSKIVEFILNSYKGM